ncbi:MAG: DegT/DnrJ/EryC1/StrS aminotransferase family protein [Candidatus Competibacteraceae bacterium]|nr:DegT/DnrJ/EryC1/StrS aminotransferase family protein [Candidatus Competibacteraceae bacterium]
MNHSYPLPRGPVLGWASFTGSRATTLPSVQELPQVALTTSGRAAIFQALSLLNLPAGSKVLVPTYHCPTMVAPVLLAGLQPIFYAVRADGLPDLDSLSRPVAANAKVLLVAHYFGFTRSLREVRGWCDQWGIVLIEDCAHAFFGQAGERSIGRWGDFAIASLSKFFPVPEGGLLASAYRPLDRLALASQDLKAAIKGWVDVIETGVTYRRWHGLNAGLNTLFRLKNRRRTVGLSLPAPVDLPASAMEMMTGCDMGRITQLPLMVSRLLLRILPRDRIVARRRENYRLYAEQFAATPGVRPLFPELPLQTVPYVFPVWFDAADKVYAGLRAVGAPVFRWDRIWPGTPTDLPDDHGIAWSRHVLQFLCHQDLSATDVRWVVMRARELAGVRQESIIQS